MTVDLKVRSHDDPADMGGDLKVDSHANIWMVSHGIDRVNRRTAAAMDLTTGHAGLYVQLFAESCLPSWASVAAHQPLRRRCLTSRCPTLDCA